MSPTPFPISPNGNRLPEASPAPDLDRWRDEGGTGSPRRRAPKGSVAPRIRTTKEGRDTADGCRERAAADLLTSVSMIIANERRRMESSAASWTARADLLDRIEAGYEARKAAAASRGTDDGGALRT